jgi:hypothetical protein
MRCERCTASRGTVRTSSVSSAIDADGITTVPPLRHHGPLGNDGVRDARCNEESSFFGVDR